MLKIHFGHSGKRTICAILAVVFCVGCAGLKTIPVRLYHGSFKVEESGLATARVLDGSGAEAAVLWKNRAVRTGPLEISWDGRDSKGKTLPPGDYRISLMSFRWKLEEDGRFGGLGSAPGRFLNPQGICAYPQGARLTLAVADTGNQRVQLLTDTGAFLQSAGDFGSGNEKLSQPTDVDWDGQILTVCDSQNRRLVRFDERGNYLGEVRKLTGLQTGLSTTPVLDFENPLCLQKAGGGNFWVSDQGRGILFRLTATGGVLEQLGNPFSLGNDGPFLEWDGSFWIRSGKDRIQTLNSAGTETGRLEPDPPFQSVADMAVGSGFALVSDRAGLLYFLDDAGKTFQVSSVRKVSAPGALSLWEDKLFIVDGSTHEIVRFRLVPEPVTELIRTITVAAPSYSGTP